MAAGSRLTVRLSPALEARLSDRVRQGGSVSDIVREALEAYLGMCQTDRQTPCQTPEAPVSDTMSDVSAKLSALASDMADMRARLAQVEAALASRRPRQTPRQTGLSDTPEGPRPAFDPVKHRLGRLCPRGHDWQGTGQSLRANNHAGYCLACNAADVRARRQARRP